MKIEFDYQDTRKIKNYILDSLNDGRESNYIVGDIMREMGDITHKLNQDFCPYCTQHSTVRKCSAKKTEKGNDTYCKWDCCTIFKPEFQKEIEELVANTVKEKKDAEKDPVYVALNRLCRKIDNLIWYMDYYAKKIYHIGEDEDDEDEGEW